MNALDQLPLLPKPRRVRPESGRCKTCHTNSVRECIESHGLPAQGYRIALTPAGITLEAADAAGAFYGRQTLRQLARICPKNIPCGYIEDWPDVLVRGVMLDISRDKVPTLQTLFLLADQFAEWKINHLQLYMEHTFAYSNHREVWAGASPFTPQEIRTLDAYCRDRFIELAPNQNSFGHFERWLKHPRYRPLAECPEGLIRPDGSWRNTPSTLDPTNPNSLTLLAELYRELLPNFTSRRFHIGCDETWELGKGRSRPEVLQRGLPQVYLEFLKKLKQLAASHGFTSLYWGDMVWNHFPERMDLLDREMVHVDWGYYRDYPFRDHGAKLAAAAVPFWVAPGTGSWHTLVGCNEAALGSNRSAAQCAIEFGAQGYLNTDWGDGGHWQHLPVSFIGWAAGASLSWCQARNTDANIRNALDPHVFQDAAGVIGNTVWSLAETWTKVMENATQANLLDRLLRRGLTQPLPAGVTEKTLRLTCAHLEAALSTLPKSRLQRPDAQEIVHEYENNARLALHACRLGLAVARGEAFQDRVRQALASDLREIITEQRRLWLIRNREGGLADSLRPLQERLAEYGGSPTRPHSVITSPEGPYA